jgi:nucleolar protein 14
MSRRLLPEAINFIASSLLILLPRRKDAKAVTYPELLAPETDLKLPTSSTTVPADPVDLASALDGDDSDEVKTNLVAVALRLIPTYAALYSSSAAFIEIFKPITSVLEGSRLPKQSPVLKVRLIAVACADGQTLHSTTSATLTRMLGFAQTSRLPLALQAHKPIPIKTFAPRFEEDFAPGHHYDPDAERNASQKLKAMYKKERKGAIRELRKDNRFLAGEKSREQAEKDREYNAKMRRAEGEINMERAEEKEMQR